MFLTDLILEMFLFYFLTVVITVLLYMDINKTLFIVVRGFLIHVSNNKT